MPEEKQWKDAVAAYKEYQTHIFRCRVCNPLDGYTPIRHHKGCEEGCRLFKESERALDIAQGNVEVPCWDD